MRIQIRTNKIDPSIVCVFLLISVFFSGTRVPSLGLTLMYVAVYLVFILTLTSGYLSFNLIKLLWFISALFLALRTTSFEISCILYEAIYFTSIFSLLLLNKKETSLSNTHSIIFWMCMCQVLIVIIEFLLRDRFLAFARSLLSDESYNEKTMFIYRSNRGFSGFAISSNASTFAGLMVLLYSLTGSKLIRPLSNTAFRTFSTISSLILFVFLGGRSNIPLILLVCLCVYYYSAKQMKGIRLVAISFFVLILILGFFIFEPILSNYSSFNRIYESLELLTSGETIDATRELLVARALEMWKKSPVFGNGFFSFYYSSTGIIRNGLRSHAHNMFFELLADVGVVGTALIILPMLLNIIDNVNCINQLKSRKCYEDQKRMCLYLGYQLFFMIDSLMHVGFYQRDIMAVYLFLIWIYREDKKGALSQADIKMC